MYKNLFLNPLIVPIMKKNFLLLCSLLYVLCFYACIKDKNNTANIEAVQSKVNVGNGFIVADSRADKTNKPFTTFSDSRRLIHNYWADNMPKMSLDENLFRIDDLLKLFGDNDKIVFIVDGIAEKQLKIQIAAYEAVKDKFNNADKGNTYYYVLEKPTLNRRTPSEFEPDGIMYYKTPEGERVTHLAATIGTDKKNSQTWYYLFLDVIKFDRNNVNVLQVRTEPPGSGTQIPQT